MVAGKERKMTKRAFFVIGPEGCGTYMLAEAFVSAGCTYCDKDVIEEFLKEQQPDMFVFRRSLPHAGTYPDVPDILGNLNMIGYKTTMVAIVRDQRTAEISTFMRKFNETYVPGDKYGFAIRVIGHYVQNGTCRLISYEYFVSSPPYRKQLFEDYGLPEPEMGFYDGNEKYYK